MSGLPRGTSPGEEVVNYVKRLFEKTVGDKIMTDTRAYITAENKLFTRGGVFVAEYARRRDAVRGAKRRGLVIA